MGSWELLSFRKSLYKVEDKEVSSLKEARPFIFDGQDSRQESRKIQNVSNHVNLSNSEAYLASQCNMNAKLIASRKPIGQNTTLRCCLVLVAAH